MRGLSNLATSPPAAFVEVAEGAGITFGPVNATKSDFELCKWYPAGEGKWACPHDWNTACE